MSTTHQQRDGVYYFTYAMAWLILSPFMLFGYCRKAFKKSRDQSRRIKELEGALHSATVSQSEQFSTTAEQVCEVRPIRAADRVVTKEISDRQRLRFWFYYAEGVVARSLITLNEDQGKPAIHDVLPLVSLSKTEPDHKFIERMVAGINQPAPAPKPATTVAVQEAEAKQMPMSGGEVKRPRSKKPESMVSYKGVFLKADIFPRIGNNGPYKQFGVELMDEQGIREHAYGADIQRCIQESGAQPGDTVLLELLKKSEIADPKGQKHSKGIWKMTVTEAGQR